MRAFDSETRCEDGHCSPVAPWARITSCQVKMIIAIIALGYLLLKDAGIF